LSSENCDSAKETRKKPEETRSGNELEKMESRFNKKKGNEYLKGEDENGDW
jgi:hypothetical protein